MSLAANDVVGPRAFGVSFMAAQDIVVERTVYQLDLDAATDIRDRAFSDQPLEQMSDG